MCRYATYRKHNVIKNNCNAAANTHRGAPSAERCIYWIFKFNTNCSMITISIWREEKQNPKRVHGDCFGYWFIMYSPAVTLPMIYYNLVFSIKSSPKLRSLALSVYFVAWISRWNLLVTSLYFSPIVLTSHDVLLFLFTIQCVAPTKFDSLGQRKVPCNIAMNIFPNKEAEKDIKAEASHFLGKFLFKETANSHENLSFCYLILTVGRKSLFVWSKHKIEQHTLAQ